MRVRLSRITAGARVFSSSASKPTGRRIPWNQRQQQTTTTVSSAPSLPAQQHVPTRLPGIPLTNNSDALPPWDPLDLYSETYDPEPVTPTCTLIVKSIPASATQQDLSDIFSLYAPHINHIRIVRDRNGDSRGFGFLAFDKLQQAIRVYDAGQDVPFHLAGNDLELSYYNSPVKTLASSVRPDRGLYITGLDWNATETDVEEFFSNFGPVESVYIGRFPDGRSRGLAIVVFDRIKDAMNVYESNQAEPYFFFKRPLKISYKSNPTLPVQPKKSDTVALVSAKPLSEEEIKTLVDGLNVKNVDLNSPRVQYITLVKFKDPKTASQAYAEINRRKGESENDNILYSMFSDGSEVSRKS